MTNDPVQGATLFSDLVNTTEGPSLETAHATVTGDSIAKILFTSGSTGMPKGVINTHRMWSSNQAMALAYFAFMADEPPVILDWLPWNHTFGGNADVGMILYCGGGFRSALAADNLQKMGYTNIISMDGGIRDWRKKGYPLSKE